MACLFDWSADHHNWRCKIFPGSNFGISVRYHPYLPQQIQAHKVGRKHLPYFCMLECIRVGLYRKTTTKRTELAHHTDIPPFASAVIPPRLRGSGSNPVLYTFALDIWLYQSHFTSTPLIKLSQRFEAKDQGTPQYSTKKVGQHLGARVKEPRSTAQEWVGRARS
jgi:hypothetical protein